MSKYDRSKKWKSDVPNLFQEVLNNPGTGILTVPFKITLSIFEEVAQRCIEINDPILNELMCDLSLYETPEKSTPEYWEMMDKVRKLAAKERKSKTK